MKKVYIRYALEKSRYDMDMRFFENKTTLNYIKLDTLLNTTHTETRY